MKSLFTILLLTFLMIFQAPAQNVIELKKPGSGIVIFKYMFNNGSICDPAGKAGLTELTASLITEGGSQQYNKSKIDNLLYPMAARYYSTVDKEVTVFTFEVHKDFTDRFYDIAKSLLLTPAFDESDFSRILSNQQVYVDQVIKASSDEDYSKMALEDLLFRNTAYQTMVSGTSSGLKSITLGDVKGHYQKYFTRDNVMIGIAGDYTEEFKTKLVNDLGQLPALAVELPKVPEISMPGGITVEIIKKPNTLGSAIYMGYPIDITRKDDEFAALMIANSWLGEHRKSYGKLYQKLRSTRSMNYGDYSYIEWYNRGGGNMLPPPHTPRHANYFSIWIRPVQTAASLRSQYEELKNIKVGHAHYAIRLAWREVDRLVKNGMTKEDFDLTKQFLRSYIKLYVQTPERELGYLMDSRFYNRNDYIGELDNLLASVTLEQVNEAVRKHFQVNNFYMAIVTDESEAGPLAESLKKNLPSPMSYSNIVKEGLPAEVLAEDEEVATYPLNIKEVKILDTSDTFK